LCNDLNDKNFVKNILSEGLSILDQASLKEKKILKIVDKKLS